MSLACSQCASSKVCTDTKEGILVCTECGVVQNQVIFDELAELFQYHNEDEAYQNTRLGPSIDTYDTLESIGTVVAGPSQIGKWSRRSSGNSKKAFLNKGLEELTAVVRSSHIPLALLESAKAIYREVYIRRHKSGKTRLTNILSCIHLAAKREGAKISLERAAVVIDTDISVILATSYRLQYRLFKLTGDDLLKNRVYLLCALLKMRGRFLEIVKFSTKQAIAMSFRCANESALAGALVYLASRYSRSFGHLRMQVLAKGLGIETQEIKDMYIEIKGFRHNLLYPKLSSEIIRFWEID